jgi:hypothetical protein
MVSRIERNHLPDAVPAKGRVQRIRNMNPDGRRRSPDRAAEGAPSAADRTDDSPQAREETAGNSGNPSGGRIDIRI